MGGVGVAGRVVRGAGRIRVIEDRRREGDPGGKKYSDLGFDKNSVRAI